MHKYLNQSDGKSAYLKLTRQSVGVLRGDIKVYMKVLKSKDKNKSANMDIKVNKELFNILKSVRQNIASVQSIPAYIVFSDATLKDMCLKLPTTKSEFLKVSGVGEVKMEKYGETFIKEIKKFKDIKK